MTASTSTVPIRIVFTVFIGSAFAFSKLLTFTVATNKAHITIRIINLVLTIVVHGILMVLFINPKVILKEDEYKERRKMKYFIIFFIVQYDLIIYSKIKKLRILHINLMVIRKLNTSYRKHSFYMIKFPLIVIQKEVFLSN